MIVKTIQALNSKGNRMSDTKQFRFNLTKIAVLVAALDSVDLNTWPEGSNERNAAMMVRRELQDALTIMRQARIASGGR